MNSGQAVLEYLLVLLITLLIASRFIGGVSESAQNSFGKIAHFLSLNLSTGACAEECFFQGYKNGRE